MNEKKQEYQDFNLYFQDESRFGLFTKNGRSLTAIGIKPICSFQQVFKYTYLFGAFSPKDGDRFLLELPYCNSDMFELFLNKLSKHSPKKLNIVILDNAAFHKTKSLNIPNNIVLIFQPPYSPEVNAAENIWAMYKREFSNKIFKTLDEVSIFIQKFTHKLTHEKIMKTTRFEYINNYLIRL